MRWIQLFVSIWIGAILFFALQDEPNPKVKWLVAIFGGIFAAWILTHAVLWARIKVAEVAGRLGVVSTARGSREQP
jgi:hypothetical protein